MRRETGSLETMPGTVNRTGPPAVDHWLQRLGQALCPPRCLVCGERGADGRDLCPPCTAALPWNRSACATCAVPLPRHGPDGAGVRLASSGTAPWPADDGATLLLPRDVAPLLPARQRCGACLRQAPALDAAHAAFVYAAPLDRLLPRFKFRRDLAAGRLLSQAMAAAFAGLPRPDALVPVPLHGARLRSRGYDQALELARLLASPLGLRVRDDLLRRLRDTAPQSTLDARRRHGNLRGAFGVRDGASVPAHVALVDDVMTTGATLHAAADALRRAGVARVDAWVCARVP